MAATVLALWLRAGPGAADARGDTAALERSYWVHASLGPSTQKGYFGLGFPATEPPSDREVANAASLLSGPYGANRLYLIYHKELPIADARRLFTWWREACPASLEIVPTLVLRMYDAGQTPVFDAGEILGLCGFFRERVNPVRVAVYDVHAGREQGEGMAVLARQFPGGVIRLGLQPGEAAGSPFAAAVQDTWSGLCHGARTREDWLQPGFGAETLRRWVEARNGGISAITWNLIVVAWDYRAPGRGGYPGYDDANKNMPLPAGRNRAAADLIRQTAERGRMGGFSCDLYILNENSRSAAHDGSVGAFYQTLRQGRVYGGYYAVPLREIVTLYHEMRDGLRAGD